MTKVDIVSGFLGAGKTTLIKKLIKDGWNNQKLVLIENEFGDIGIDGGFMKEAGIEVTEMNSGCICCSLVGDFGVALKDVVKQYSPDRIIIEPSGVGKLSDVIKAIQDVADEAGIEVNNFVAVVDAKKAKMYMKNFGEFFNNQIEYAKTIILSRTQDMSQDKLEKTVALIKEHNDKATIITTPWDDITGSKIMSAMEEPSLFADELLKEAEVCPTCGHHHAPGEHCDHDHEHEHHHDHDEHDHEHHHDHDEHDHEHHHDHDEHDHEHHHDHDHDHEHHHDHEHECSCGHDHHHHGHHHADDVFTSWGKETPKKYSDEEMEEILEELAQSGIYGGILRAKGIVPNNNGEWIHFDLTPGEYEVRHGEADVTGRICVIGTELKEDKLKELFGL
ncbi:MAG: GTP-binding protein [Lachnospiraceae bacterium]|nr:GTP-binding protein [Lachnospiraceae bacterium]